MPFKEDIAVRILLVEDDRRLGDLLQRGLSKRHTVDWQDHGQAGLEQALNGEYDLLILDVRLPGIDGISICKTLRTQNVNASILMLTARDSVEDKVLGLAAGADDYLTKPFSFLELDARIQALSRRPKQFVDESVFRVRDLEMRPDLFEVRKDGVEIELTRKEFALLELFMRNANRTLTREQILDRVWGTDDVPMTNVVDALVVRLRQKIDAKDQPLIQTVRGVGYKMTL